MNNRKVISLFSGAGGMDIGFENAGFEIVAAIEADKSCCDTLRKNMPGVIIFENQIEDVSASDLLKIIGLKPLEPGLVIGGPPCQPFSLAGRREGLNVPKGNLFRQFARIVRESLPVGFVLENVKGLLNWGNGIVKDALIDEFSKPIDYKGKTYKYEIEYKLLNAIDYGVPQQRERVFFVGNRVGVKFKFPNPTHGEKNLLNQDVLEYQNVGDAIGHLPPADEPSETAKNVAKSIAGRITKHGY